MSVGLHRICAKYLGDPTTRSDLESPHGYSQPGLHVLDFSHSWFCVRLALDFLFFCFVFLRTELRAVPVLGKASAIPESTFLFI